jgi:acetyltransferase
VLFATEGIEEELATERDALEAAGIPTFETPERAADAAGVLARYAQLHAVGSPSDTATDGGQSPPTGVTDTEVTRDE